jgi:hypothetical protein
MRFKPKQAQAVAEVIKQNEGTAIELEQEGNTIHIHAGKQSFAVGAGGKVTNYTR